MNSTAHVRPESEISLEQGVCCAVWGRQTTMQMRANQFLPRSQSCSQHAVDSQSTTTAKDLQNQYKIKMYLYKSTCTYKTRYEVYIRVQYFMYSANKKENPYKNRYRYTKRRTKMKGQSTAKRTYHLRGSAGGDTFSF